MKAFPAGVFLLCSFPVLAQSGGRTATSKPLAKPDPKAMAALAQRGQFVLEHYCVRCHTPPQGFSPRISETVAMHMRVRASLSDTDFKALVHFLNP